MPARQRTAAERPVSWQTRELIPGLAHLSQAVDEAVNEELGLALTEYRRELSAV